MPALDQIQAQQAVKAILMGESGTGKTGALASLAKAGYKIRILDFDNGTPILGSILKRHSPASMKNVLVEQVSNKFKGAGPSVIPSGSPDAWSKAMAILNNWPGEGPVEKWGNDTVLVIDTMTFAAKAAFEWVLFLNGRSGKQPFQSDFGDAQRAIEGLLAMLFSDAIKCNVICVFHVDQMGEGKDGQENIKSYPATIGRALNKSVGAYFNNAFRVKSIGSGTAVKRFIRTASEYNCDLKTSDPYSIPSEIEFKDADGGLAIIFEKILGEPPSSKAKTLATVATN